MQSLASNKADKSAAKVKAQVDNRKKTAKSTSKDMAQLPTNNQVVHCCIREDIINEPNEPNGDDSVLCNGTCTCWIHRRCAGLSQVRFKEISKSDDPFYCPSCCATNSRKEIKALKSTIKNLGSMLNVKKKTVCIPALLVITVILAAVKYSFFKRPATDHSIIIPQSAVISAKEDLVSTRRRLDRIRD